MMRDRPIKHLRGLYLRKRLRKFVTTTGFASLLLVAMVSAPAFAQGIAYSSNYYYSVWYNYYNWAAIDTTTGQPATAWTEVFTNGGFNVPAGYMGAYPIMFYSNGAICRQGSWEYNGSASNNDVSGVGPGCGAGPVYYSQGVSSGWNGSGYSDYYTNRSPNENS
jgi:hypothetical protein